MAKDETSLQFDPTLSVFKLHDGSQLQDMTPHISNMDFGDKDTEVDLTTYGSTGYKPGLTTDISDFTIDFIWNQVTATGVDTVVGAMKHAKVARAFEYYPAGTTTGNTKYSGNCVCIEFTITGKVGDAIRAKALFKAHNGATRGTA